MGVIIGIFAGIARTLLFSRWGPLVLLMALVVALALQPDLRKEVLLLLGLGVVPVGLWLALFLGSLRGRPRWVWGYWRWWAGGAVLVAAALGAVAYVQETEVLGMEVPATLMGSDGKAILGGSIGRAINMDSTLLGVLQVLALLLLAAFVIRTRLTYRAVRGSMRQVSLTLRKTAQGGYRGIRWPLKAGGGKASVVPQEPPPPMVNGEWAEEEQPAPPGDESVPATVTDEGEEQEATVRDEAVPEREPKGARGSVHPWRLPSLDIYEPGSGSAEVTEENLEVARRIEESLSHHGVEVTVEQIKPGPTVTLYGLAPGWVRRQRNARGRDQRDKEESQPEEGGAPVKDQAERQMRVKVDSILAREKDLALALAAPSLRIQAPVPGESVVGIEVPNREPLLVTIRSVMETPVFQDIPAKRGLPLALGQGSGGDTIIADLRKLPHLLIAGATGSGKSVCLNALIVSLASAIPPDYVRFLLVDPKRVELTAYNGLPHLVAPVVVETDDVVPSLRGVMREMLRRYRTFEELGVRNIESYHRHPQRQEQMPYLVVAIDELADLMMAAPYDVEQTLCRLAQLGRATGVHLIVATQRPSVDVVTGLIKANFPSRISFAVVSQVDSRTIMDGAGAEKLLGKGDMLFLSSDSPKPQRVQGAFVSDREIGKLVGHWREQHGPPLPTFDLEPEPDASVGEGYAGDERGGSRDELMDKAKELATRTKLSTSLLQRRLRIGYPRAARLMDDLEEEGFLVTGDAERS